MLIGRAAPPPDAIASDFDESQLVDASQPPGNANLRRCGSAKPSITTLRAAREDLPACAVGAASSAKRTASSRTSRSEAMAASVERVGLRPHRAAARARSLRTTVTMSGPWLRARIEQSLHHVRSGEARPGNRALRAAVRHSSCQGPSGTLFCGLVTKHPTAPPPPPSLSSSSTAFVVRTAAARAARCGPECPISQ